MAVRPCQNDEDDYYHNGDTTIEDDKRWYTHDQAMTTTRRAWNPHSCILSDPPRQEQRLVQEQILGAIGNTVHPPYSFCAPTFHAPETAQTPSFATGNAFTSPDARANSNVFHTADRATAYNLVHLAASEISTTRMVTSTESASSR